MSKRKAGNGIDWDAQPLGQVADSDLAARLHVSTFAVWYQRKARGLPAHGRGRPPKYNWDSLPLGEMADIDLAERFGLRLSTVNAARRRRGIKSFTEQQRDAAALWPIPTDPATTDTTDTTEV